MPKAIQKRRTLGTLSAHQHGLGPSRKSRPDISTLKPRWLGSRPVDCLDGRPHRLLGAQLRILDIRHRPPQHFRADGTLDEPRAIAAPDARQRRKAANGPIGFITNDKIPLRHRILLVASSPIITSSASTVASSRPAALCARGITCRSQLRRSARRAVVIGFGAGDQAFLCPAGQRAADAESMHSRRSTRVWNFRIVRAGNQVAVGRAPHRNGPTPPTLGDPVIRNALRSRLHETLEAGRDRSRDRRRSFVVDFGQPTAGRCKNRFSRAQRGIRPTLASANLNRHATIHAPFLRPVASAPSGILIRALKGSRNWLGGTFIGDHVNDVHLTRAERGNARQ